MKKMKQFIYIIIFLLMISLVSALTLQQLVDSYDYNYINGSINISQYANGMLDTNANGISDTLVFNLTAVPFVTGRYDTIVILSNNQGIWTSNTSKDLTTTGLVQVNFSTLNLNGTVWNYTVRIFDANNVAVFEKYNQLTNTYSNYENGTFIKSISDSNLNNNSINITVVLNVSKTETANITVFLKYNSTNNLNITKNATISAKTEASLTAGQEQNVTIIFDNETIKSSHYNGTFLLESIKIGEKAIKTSYTTSPYNYEDFAKTSYFKAYNHSFTDDNGNGLYEFLKLNLTLNVTTADTYNISGALYDLFDNQVYNFSEIFVLGAGIKVVNLSFNGSQIYQTYISGPYIIKYMSLKNSTGTTLDFVSEPYATNSTAYSDYERPKLPDLVVKITPSVDTTTAQTNITLNISNKGSAGAVGMSVDLLDNTSVIKKNETIASLGPNEWQTFNYTLTNMNSTNISYVAIVDLFNSIDELNDSNNVNIYPQAPTFENSSYTPTSPKFNDTVSFNITIKGDLNGSYYVFSYNNGSGFINDSAMLWDGTTRVEVNKTLTGKQGVVVQWQWFANDSQNALGTSNVYNLTIANTVPTAEIPVFNVTIVTKTSGVKANSTYRDVDMSNGSVYFTWYRNGSAIFTENFTNIIPTTVVNSTLSTLLYSKSDSINVTVYANDGTSNSSINYSATFVVANVVPSQSTPILNSTFGTNLTTENITIYNVSTADADNDPVKNIYNWFRNNTPIAVANLPFEGGSNSSFTKDYSSLENNGTVNGAVWNASSGYDGKGAYNFSGAGANNITLKNSQSLNITGNQLTLEAWIRPYGSGNRQIIARAAGTAGTQRQYGLWVNSFGALAMEIRNGTDTVSIAGGTITNGVWAHVVGIYNGTNIIIYVDGQQRNIGTQTGNIQAQISDVQIGEFPAGFSKFNGTIDEVRIYNIFLTAEQVLAHYRNRTDVIAGSTLANQTLLSAGDTWNASVTPNDGIADGATLYTKNLTIRVNRVPTHATPILNSTLGTNTTAENLTVYNISTFDADNDPVKNIYNWFRNNTPIAVANLPFEGGSNATFTKDYSSLDNNGTVNGPTWNATGGYDGKGAYNFSGAGANNITLTNSPSLNITGDQLTLEAWIRPQGPAGFKQIIARASGTGTTQRQYGLYVHSAGTLGFEVRTANGLADNNFGTITSGNWYYVVGTYNGTDMLYYIDGVQVGNASQTGNIQGQVSDVQIGQFPGGFSKFNGTIDEVRIYNISLTAEQVLAHYRNRTNVIAGSTFANRTLLRIGDTWNASVTPNDGTADGITKYSNNLTFFQNRPPTQSTPILNSTYGTNLTTENLTVYNISTQDPDKDNVTNIISWYINNSPVLIANLPFEGGTNGTNATDYSGRGANGIGTGNIVYENASGFDGFGVANFTRASSSTKEYYNLSGTNTLNLDNSSFSIEVWALAYGSDVNSADIVIRSDSTSAQTSQFWLRHRASGSGNIEFLMGNTTDFTQSIAAQNYSDRKWHHIIAVRDKKEGRQYLYVDNILRANTSNVLTNLRNAASPFVSVGDHGFLTNVRAFNGSIAVLRIWNTSLSTEQIALLWQNRTDMISSSLLAVNQTWNASITPNDGIGDGATLYTKNLTIRANSAPTHSTPILNSTSGTNTTLENLTVYNISTQDVEGDAVKNIYNWFRNNTPIAVANLPFEGGSNATFTRDYSSLENNGTVSGATWSSSSGYDSFGAYNFSGTGANNITLTNSPSLNITGDQLTLEAWIKPQGPAGFKQIIARASGTGSTQRQYGLYVHSAGTLGFEVRTANGLGDNNFGTITNNTWTHVVGVYNGTMMIYYINGVEVGNQTQSGNIAAQVSDVQIGQFPGGFSKFNGTIDEVRIYNISLTAEQVFAHYRNRTDIIAGSSLSNRTLLKQGDTWNASITPNDKLQDGITKYSNNLTII